MDKIIITDLVATGVIGVEHPERDSAQGLRINLTLYKDLSTAGKSDQLAHTVSYSTVAKSVRQLVANTSYHLVEALADQIVEMLLETYPIDGVLVRVEKPRFVMGTESVGIEIERWREAKKD